MMVMVELGLGQAEREEGKCDVFFHGWKLITT